MPPAPTNIGPSPEKLATARSNAAALRTGSYSTPTLECDLVMKGGITSGVVYPLAACELARTYRFKNIGGSSAGAIAACLVAAAEYAREDGGFNRLAALPDELGPNLTKLFTPGAKTRTAHAALMAWLKPDRTKSAKVRQVVSTLLRSQRKTFWGVTLIALVVAAGAGMLLAGLPDDGVAAIRWAGITLALLTIGVGIAGVLAIVAEARCTLAGMAEQGFGVCVGSNGQAASAAGNGDPGALTDWLSARIDSIAGVDRPLLVSDLLERGVNLQVMTTNLTHARPMCFPFDSRVFLFDPTELGVYFPPPVIEALCAGQAPATDENGKQLLSAADRPLYQLPPAEQLPVILAARISLSFPGLISAVPLYAVDYSRKDPADQLPVRCWFSDGGITSNFPIHFFDSLWPRRPTFALDLRGYHPDYLDHDTYYAGTQARQPRVTTIESVPGFLSAILNTMQYWADDAQATLPGYRDRVAEVHLHGYEGGMNLQMPDDVITIVAEKGRQAAQQLATEFDADQHRYTRYLISMGRMQDAVQRMNKVFAASPPELPTGVGDLIDNSKTFGHYGQTHEWSVKARARTETLLAFAGADDPDFVADAPRPETMLRITPKF